MMSDAAVIRLLYGVLGGGRAAPATHRMTFDKALIQFLAQRRGR